MIKIILHLKKSDWLMEGPQIPPLTTSSIQTLHLLLVFHSSFAQPVKKEVVFSSSACTLKVCYVFSWKFRNCVIIVLSTALIYIPLAIPPNFLFTFFTTMGCLAKGFKGFFCNNFNLFLCCRIFLLADSLPVWFFFLGLSVCIHLHLLLARPGSLMTEIFSSSMAVSIWYIVAPHPITLTDFEIFPFNTLV